MNKEKIKNTVLRCTILASLTISSPVKSVEYYLNVNGLPSKVKAYVSIEKEKGGFTSEKEVTKRDSSKIFYSSIDSHTKKGRYRFEYNIRLKYKVGIDTEYETINTVESSSNNAPLTCLYTPDENHETSDLKSIHIEIIPEIYQINNPLGNSGVRFKCNVSGKYKTSSNSKDRQFQALDKLLKDPSFKKKDKEVKIQQLQKAANLNLGKIIEKQKVLEKALKDKLNKITSECKNFKKPSCKEDQNILKDTIELVESFDR